MTYDWDWGAVSHLWPQLLQGCVMTLQLTVLIIVVGTPAGILTAILIRMLPQFCRGLLLVLIDVVRSIPPLVLIFFMYYLLPVVFRYGRISAFAVAWLALTVYLAAFTADVVRGAFANVARGAVDAGRAVGLSRWTILRRIELPTALRSIMPTIALLWIGMLKNSSLASVIGVYELTHTANLLISNTFRSVELYSLVALCYVVIIFPFSVLARRVEARLQPSLAEVS